MLELELTKKAIKELKYWQQTKPKIYKKILEMVGETRQNPFSGRHKPEPLKYDLSGLWSRRITKEHRLVYEVVGNKLIIHQCRYHY